MVLVNTFGKLARSGDLPADLEQELRFAIEKVGHFLELEDNYEPDHNHGLNEASALLLIAENFSSLGRAGAWR